MQVHSQGPGSQAQVGVTGQGAGPRPEGCVVSVAMGEAGAWGVWGCLLRALNGTPFLPVRRAREPHWRPGGLAMGPREITPSAHHPANPPIVASCAKRQHAPAGPGPGLLPGG